MPAMAMQCVHMGTFSAAHSPAARRSRCFVKTMAVVAAPPKTTLKTEKSEKVLSLAHSGRRLLPFLQSFGADIRLDAESHLH